MEQDIQNVRLGLISPEDFKAKHGEDAYYDALGVNRRTEQPPAPTPEEQQSFFAQAIDTVQDVAVGVVRGALNAGAEARETWNGVNSVTPEEFDTNFNDFMNKKAEARGAPFSQKELDMAWLEQRKNYREMGIDISEVSDRPDLNVDVALENIADAGGPDLTTTLAKSDSMIGSASEGISQFMTGFFALGGGKTFVGSMLKGGVVDATMFDAFEGNLSTFVEEEYPHLSNPLTEALKIDPNDPEWTNRAKNAIEGGLIGGVAEGTLRLVSGAVKLVGLGRKAKTEIESLGQVSDETAAQLDEAHAEVNDAIEADGRDTIDGMVSRPDGTFETPDGAVYKLEDSTFVEISPPRVEPVEAPREAPEALEEPQLDVDGPAAVRSPEPQAQIEVDQPIAPNAVQQSLADQRAAVTIKPKAKIAVIDRDKMFAALQRAADTTDMDIANVVIDGSSGFNLGRMDGPVDALKIINEFEDVLKSSKGMKAMGLDKPQTNDTTVRRALQYTAESTGTDVNKIIRELNIAETMTRDTAARIVAGKMAMQSTAREINLWSKRLVKAQEDGSISDAMEARLVDLMQMHMEVQANVKGLQTAAARATQAGRIVTSDTLEGGTLEAISAFGGSKRIRSLAAELSKVTDEKLMARTVKKAVERKGLRVLNEFWINSILSGPTTHALNITSNTINVLARPGERAIGALLNGDTQQAKEALRTYKYMAYYFKDALKLAAKSGYNMKPVLDDSVKIENASQSTTRAISSEYIGGGTTVDILGKMLTIPSRLLGSEDEFFKQLAYRSALQARLSTDVAFMSMKDIQKAGYASREEWIAGNFENAFNTKIDAEQKWQETVALGKIADDEELKKNFIDQYVGSYKSGNKYAEMALNEAREATFTTKLTQENSIIAKSFQDLANKHPLMRQITPFIQTPMNIMGQAWDRTPLLNMLRKQYRADLYSGDPTRVAQAKGKMAVGTAIYGTLSVLAWDDRITGGGPTDPKLAKLWRDSPDWQPYSINFGTKEKPYWVSYARMDPWTTAFGIIGDMKEMVQIGSMDDTTWSDMTSMFVAAVGNNIVSKTYLQGIADTVSILDSKDSPWEVSNLFKQRLASLMPYSGFTNQVGNLNDEYTREVRTVMDKLRKSTGIQRSSLPIQYDWLTGKPKNTPETLGPLFHITTKGVEEIETDAALVATEFRKLGFKFEGARRTVGGGVKLTGEQYQRWNQLMGSISIGGRNLEQTLAREIKKTSYNKDGDDYGDVAPSESHRTFMLNRRMKKFRDRAYRKLQREFPIIREQVREFDRFKRATKRGKDVDRPELDLSQID